jgi:hypothetical protein
MTHLAWPQKVLHRLYARLSGSRSTYAPINPVLLHGGIVRPELCNDVIPAGKQIPHSDRNLGDLFAGEDD